MSPITKDTVWAALKDQMPKIAEAHDKRYADELNDLVEDLADTYNELYQVINHPDQDKIPDNEFHAFALCWTGLNTLLAALTLFREGYPREPHMLTRNALEIFATAYDIAANRDRFEILTKTPDKFDSTDSIKEVKKAHPIVAKFYGALSEKFTHVNVLHLMPHKSATPLCVGGLYDPKEQETVAMGLMMLVSSVEVCSVITEHLLARYI
ncbi:hypothetical protein K2Q08_02250, partial [Patescibacteria group bacterium]|nr:hypothetical protein [Patescibacteria group bacterium]